MRSVSYLIAIAGIAALGLTSFSNATPESNLPTVPARVAIAEPTSNATDSDVIEMKNWNDTKLNEPALGSRTRR